MRLLLRFFYSLLIAVPLVVHAGQIVSEEENVHWAKDPYQSAWDNHNYDVVHREAAAVRENVAAALYMRDSLEYRVLVRQNYLRAERLLQDVPNRASALLEQARISERFPPAVIINIDQVVFNIIPALSYRLSRNYFIHPFLLPHGVSLRDDFSLMPGAVRFIARVREQGIHLFFLSDRICDDRRRDSDQFQFRCPQRHAIIRNLRHFGIQVSPDDVLLAGARPEWGMDKTSRRRFIGRHYHVIMQLSSGLSDFMPIQLLHRARQAGSLDSFVNPRMTARWILFPNPLYGDWHHEEKVRWCGRVPIRSLSCLRRGLAGDRSFSSDFGDPY